MRILHASCLCGGIKFEIDGTLVAPSNCHRVPQTTGDKSRCSRPRYARLGVVVSTHVSGKPPRRAAGFRASAGGPTSIL